MKRKFTRRPVTAGSSREMVGSQLNDKTYQEIYRNMEAARDEVYEYLDGQNIEGFWVTMNANSYKPEKYGYEATLELLTNNTSKPGLESLAHYEFSDEEAVNIQAVLSTVDDMIDKINKCISQSVTSSRKISASSNIDTFEDYVNEIIKKLPAGDYSYELDEDEYGGEVAEVYKDDEYLGNISDWDPDTDEQIDFNDKGMMKDIIEFLKDSIE